MLGTYQKESMMKNQEFIYKNMELNKTGFGYTLSLINGKYKMLIIYAISMNTGPIRYNELKRRIGSISFKTLTKSLKELEKDGLIIRKEYPQVPPKVEYDLTQLGLSLIPVLDEICYWGEKQINNKKN